MGLFADIKAALGLLKKDTGYKATNEEFDSIVAFAYILAECASINQVREIIKDKWSADAFYYCRYEFLVMKRMLALAKIIVVNKYHIEHEYTPMLDASITEIENTDSILYDEQHDLNKKQLEYFKEAIEKQLDRLEDRTESLKILCRMVALV